mmetsp:Transcript_16669/g.39214  ORF Transcript_16669/g.39214 Transcript_16669/m.39214 type:complete len:791 (+) Transcript_16669:35-2407(+)
MAEAHSAQLACYLKSGVKLFSDDEGFHFELNVPPPRLVARRTRRYFRNFVTRIVKWVHPLHPSAAALIPIGLGAIVLRSKPDSWLRSGPFSNFVWKIVEKMPLFETFSPYRSFQIAGSSAVVGAIGSAGIVAAERFILRNLLRYHGWLREDGRTVKRSFTTKAVFTILTFFKLHNPSLYSWQTSLPRMPVPPLAETCQKFLKSVSPLLSPEEFQKVQAMADEFQRKEGPTLQFYLWIKSWWSNNYVTDFWENYVYLLGRSSIMINSNYYILDIVPGPPTKNQCARAGNIAHHFMRFKRNIDYEQPMDLLMKVPPWCMKQYERMFSTTRLPGRQIDTIKHFDEEESSHVVVVRKGLYFAFDVVHPNGELLSPWEIEEQMTAVMTQADALAAQPGGAERLVASLTSWDRTKWAEARDKLANFPVNSRTLDIIDRAVFVVILEDQLPSDLNSIAKSAMSGDGSTRWFDKSINLIVFPEGTATLNCEHSWADAPVIAHLVECSFIPGRPEFGGMYREDGRNVEVVHKKFSSAPRPKQLQWVINEDVKADIGQALVAAKELIDDTNITILQFDSKNDEIKGFGKAVMKRAGISPDGFVQMAMQLAYYKTYHKPALTYESSVTRFFREGRTETNRSCTPESCEFVRLVVAGASRSEQARALRHAVETHKENALQCMTGHGVDRHLFALYIVSVGKKTPSEFLQAWRDMPWVLSTSQVPQWQTPMCNPKNPDHAKTFCPGGGFGPVAKDGYGVSYMVLEDSIFFHISSKPSQTDPEPFIRNLKASLFDMRDLLMEFK